jgi:NAD(P)H-hydrate epimerase
MKIFDVNQIREADKFTIEHQPIASIDLMERAATACVNWITERYDIQTEFKIVCGLGNNGADGLAIARHLTAKKYQVNVFIINYSEKRSADFSTNYERLKSIISNNLKVIEISSIESLENSFQYTEQSILIDAIFGSGLNKPAAGFIADVINFINLSSPERVISIDVPSGMYCDELNDVKDFIVKAKFTLSFQFPKLSFMFPETSAFVGEFTVLDIGLHIDYINHTQTKNYFITRNDVYVFLKTRSKIAHKGNFGHALIVAGSYGKIGSAVLAGKACMHTGVGLLTIHIPKCGYEILQTSVPEIMVDVDSEANYLTDNIRLEKYNAIGVGPGIGVEKQTQNVVKLLIQNTIVPIVFDADAINSISENKTWLSFIPVNSIFTPHPKEFERLAGKSENSVERLKLQREFSSKYSVYVVLKGAHTSVSCPNGELYFNSTGNPGMATAGSGDVLTGIITSLIAQGYTSQQACILGVYLHGLAGDFAAHEKSEECMIASDIIEHLPDAFKFLKA